MKKLIKYKNKKILVTGHTGFKGSWLCLWLLSLGAKVIGISDKEVSKPSNFKASKLKNKIIDYRLDIRNKTKLKNILKKHKPDFIFHLAAQSLVKKSYIYPKETFETNAIGTLNLLDSINEIKLKKRCNIILITSDKSYKNLEIKRGYHEKDILGGIDPYSASKACAELIIQSYFKSYFKKNKFIRMAVARAGNVVGGGDWSEDRIVPDCIKSCIKQKTLVLRNPTSTRPWQHVLEAISGYLILGEKLSSDNKLNGEIFNFGPNYKKSISVLNLIKKIKKKWPKLNWKIKKNKGQFESKLLKLNSYKAKKILGWRCILSGDETIEYVVDWYKHYYQKKNDTYNFSKKQIYQYYKKLKMRLII